MEPVVLLFVVLALVIAVAYRTLRRGSRHDDDPGGADRASAEAKGNAQALLPPSARGGAGGTF